MQKEKLQGLTLSAEDLKNMTVLFCSGIRDVVYEFCEEVKEFILSCEDSENATYENFINECDPTYPKVYNVYSWYLENAEKDKDIYQNMVMADSIFEDNGGFDAPEVIWDTNFRIINEEELEEEA